MHEVALVAELIALCERRAGGRPIGSVHVRHASTIEAPVLEQAFRMLTADGALAGTTLVTEPVELRLTCGCGFDGALGHDDLISASVVVCPACGEVSTQQRIAELELVEVR